MPCFSGARLSQAQAARELPDLRIWVKGPQPLSRLHSRVRAGEGSGDRRERPKGSEAAERMLRVLVACG